VNFRHESGYWLLRSLIDRAILLQLQARLLAGQSCTKGPFAVPHDPVLRVLPEFRTVVEEVKLFPPNGFHCLPRGAGPVGSFAVP
jgi:hypothetical protein